jgi:hypothetical protein
VHAGLTFASPTLTVNSAANGNGAVGLSGNTSACTSFATRAVAGTSTNPVTMSKVLLGRQSLMDSADVVEQVMWGH